MRETKPQLEINSFDNLSAEQKANCKIAIIVAKWNASFNQEMLESGVQALKSAELNELNYEIFEVPGAYEMPVTALKLAKTKKYQAIICYGTIIKGSTYHFNIVADESARGLMDVMLATGVPILNGILATNTSEQAEIRASTAKEDKGKEIALSALETISCLAKIG